MCCHGVMKRMLLGWIKGPLKQRLVGSIIEKQISSELIPSEFARKPRKLAEIDRWKATVQTIFTIHRSFSASSFPS